MAGAAGRGGLALRDAPWQDQAPPRRRTLSARGDAEHPHLLTLTQTRTLTLTLTLILALALTLALSVFTR